VLEAVILIVWTKTPVVTTLSDSGPRACYRGDVWLPAAWLDTTTISVTELTGSIGTITVVDLGLMNFVTQIDFPGVP
jgi:hypothetical protein